MSQSKRYKELLSEVNRLERFYLGFKKRVAGDYNQRQLSSGAAFTIFTHAEIESFFEDWASRILERAEKRWKAGSASRALVHLMTFRDSQTLSLSIPNKDIWNSAITSATLWYKDVIGRNHGIKDENICKLFVPLGFDVREIDEILIADLKTFAVIRGEHAHKTARVHLGQQFDPFDRSTKVNNIVKLLAVLDNQLSEYIKKC